MNSLCARKETRKRHMKFVVVNGRTPRPQSFCALCCEPIGESYLRELTTRLSYCDHSATPVTASFASQRSKSMQGRHDNHRRSTRSRRIVVRGCDETATSLQASSL